MNNWGVEIKGAEMDLAAWKAMLKSPFDPFVEEVAGEHGNYLALRSSAFNGLPVAAEVHKAAKLLFSTLNVTMSKNADADPVTHGAVVEFVSDGPPRKHQFVEVVEPIAMRTRVFLVTVTVKDADGNVTESKPAPSRAQEWMRAAALAQDIGAALRYLEGKPGWVELYKAYEAVRLMPNGGISRNEIKRFTQTANTGDGRHRPNNKWKPHSRPMELWEARALITQWVSAAIEDLLAKYPLSPATGASGLTETEES